MTIAHHFASELGRFRELTSEEITMLSRRKGGTRRMWTQADDRQLSRMLAKQLTAEQIATALGRTAFAVRSRVRQMKRLGLS